jgi:hypothetical protein
MIAKNAKLANSRSEIAIKLSNCQSERCLGVCMHQVLDPSYDLNMSAMLPHSYVKVYVYLNLVLVVTTTIHVLDKRRCRSSL